MRNLRRPWHLALLLAATLPLGACSATPHHLAPQHAPELGAVTKTQKLLWELPLPPEPIAVAVYGFSDQTGQFKPSENGQSLSRAVSQGATSILVKAMEDAGQGGWFAPVEREHLDDLLKERQIIREMRAKYLSEEGINAAVLPPMLYAGVIFEGGVIGFDSNTLTGGAGAKFLGIGANVKYKQDTVSVYLRAVSTKTGEVLASVVVRKSIASIGAQADAFRFVDFKQLLELEAGRTVNEPAEFALQQAVQKAVVALIMEGNERGLWDFAVPAEAVALLDAYDVEKGISRWSRKGRGRPARRADMPPAVVSKPGPSTSTSGDPDLSSGPPVARFDPATAATTGGQSEIARSAAGVSTSPPPRPAATPAPISPPK